MARAVVLFVALLSIVGCADASKSGDISTSPNDVSINRTYSLSECVDTKAPPPCFYFTSGGHDDTADSAVVAFSSDHTAKWKLGITTRVNPCYLGGPCSSPTDSSTSVDSASGTYRISGDTVIVTLAPGDTTNLAFIADIPQDIPPSWPGPDSLVFNVDPVQTHWVVLKPK